MKKCFVIQPFDDDVFDVRYDAVFAPAIKDAGAEPYRVDRDPSVGTPIQEIENGIKYSELCFAEITTDNPNVWYELGFAYAIHQQVLLVCSNERQSRYPFDIQHRTVIPYKTGSPQGFDELKKKIIQRVKAILQNSINFSRLTEKSLLSDSEGLSNYETVALGIIFRESMLTNGSTSAWNINNIMQKEGFSEMAVGIALKLLLGKSMIEMNKEKDDYGAEYSIFKTSLKGETWILNNQDKFTLKNKIDIDPDLPF